MRRAAKPTLIIRGIRTLSDYELELQMAHLNSRMRPETETVFLPAKAEYSFISSRMVKEIITLGGDAANSCPKLFCAPPQIPTPKGKLEDSLMSSNRRTRRTYLLH